MRYTKDMPLPAPGTKVRVCAIEAFPETFGEYLGQVGEVILAPHWHAWDVRMPDGFEAVWFPLTELASLTTDDDNEVDP